VSDLRTEEEQIEALKKWWSENGKSLLLSVGLAVVVVFGYRAWQNQQTAQQETASDIYFQLINALSAADSTEDEILSLSSLSSAEQLTNTLKSDYESTAYASYAALLMASRTVDFDNLTEAESQLRWVVERASPEDSIYPIAKLRLARIIAAKGDEVSLQAGLAELEGLEAGAHQTSVDETRGDIYLALGQQDNAREAYRQSLAAAESVGLSRPMVSIKLSDLAGQGEG